MTPTNLKTSVVFRNVKFKFLSVLETKNICRYFILFQIQSSGCSFRLIQQLFGCQFTSYKHKHNKTFCRVSVVMLCMFSQMGKMIEELRKIILTKPFFSTSHKYRREHNLDDTYKIDHWKKVSPLNPQGFCSFVLKQCKNKTHENVII